MSPTLKTVSVVTLAALTVAALTAGCPDDGAPAATPTPTPTPTSVECSGDARAACDDGNPCTDDDCVAGGACLHPANTAACTDGNACNGVDTCLGGACVGGAETCDDGNPCTGDECDPAEGCLHTEVAGPCDDGDACTGADTCDAGRCAGGAPVDCDDADPCTDDDCDAAQGCRHSASTGACDDGDACTQDDVCSAGVCRGAARGCCPDPDANPACRGDLDMDTCLANGGSWARGGLNPQPFCQCPTRDAHCPCMRASDCDGLCAAELGAAGCEDVAEGQCSAWRVVFGCMCVFDDSGDAAGLCID